MASLAEIGERIGIPPDRLEDFIELPCVAQAIQTAAENPTWAPASVWSGVGRPTYYPRKATALDLKGLEQEKVKIQGLTTRQEDGEVVWNRLASPLATGRMQRAEKIARRRLGVIATAEDSLRQYIALQGEASLHEHLAKARAVLNEEMRRSEGGEL